MQIKKHLQNSFVELRKTIARFPISVICSILFFLLTCDDIWKSYGDYGSGSFTTIDEVLRTRLLTSLAYGFFWFGAAKLFAESKKYSLKQYFFFSSLLFIPIGYQAFNAYELSPFIHLLLAGIITFVLVAPFIGRKSDDAYFYNFSTATLFGLLYSMLLALIFSGALSIIMITVDKLFGVDVSEKLYSTIWMLGSTLLAPLYGLSNVPSNFNQKGEVRIQKGINFILSYVLVPLGLVYMLILYAYGLKILINWELPKGLLSAMICGFGAAGLVIKLAVYPLREKGSVLVRNFYNYFCFAFLPLLVLLAVAISTRISEYGVTESRYLVVAAGIWFLITCGIYIFRNDSDSMKYGPFVLAILLILASFGPWSATSISVNSQFQRLEALFAKYNMVQKGKLVAAPKDINFDDKYSISSIINYLEDVKGIDKLDKYFDTKPGQAHKILENLNIGYVSEYDRQSATNQRFSYYSSSSNKQLNVIEVSNYSHFIANVNACSSSYCTSADYYIGNKTLSARVEISDLIILVDGKELTRFKAEELIKAAESGSYIVEKKTDNAKIKLIIYNLDGEHKPVLRIENISLSIAIKL